MKCGGTYMRDSGFRGLFTRAHTLSAMTQTFIIKGIDPVTHRLVEIRIVAEDKHAAKHRAEEAGFEKVTVRPATPTLDEKKD